MRYRLTLLGGPNCGSATLTDVAVWPPPMFLYVKGYAGCYRRSRVSAPEVEALDFRSATYEWLTS